MYSHFESSQTVIKIMKIKALFILEFQGVRFLFHNIHKRVFEVTTYT